MSIRLQQYSRHGSRQWYGSMTLLIPYRTTDGPIGVDAAGRNWPLTVVTCWSKVKSAEINKKRALSVAVIVSFPICIAARACVETVRLEPTQITSDNAEVVDGL